MIKPLNTEDYYMLDDMSLRDSPVIALIEKVNELIQAVNALTGEEDEDEAGTT